ncbi:MAG TPA: TylF/MycF/NovP-related O-methyltransferase [Gammaproteobacteria bacterium]|nr:TylF/MycF/NovP-related O-methyltransferase [Gammaproteobacteria bacterium]
MGLLDKVSAQLGIVRTNLVRESGKAYRKLLAPAGVRELPPKYPQDFAPFTRSLWDRVSPYTMTTQERVVNLEYAVRYLEAAGIPGDIVECGVGAGGSMMAVAWTLLELGSRTRRIFLYDTYRGMAMPTDEDVSVFGKPAKRKYERKMKDGQCTWHNYPLPDVQRNLALTGYPADRLVFVEGFVQDTLPANDSASIALLRLDTNLYESTKAEMQHLWPKLAPGGVFLVDDYFRWLGQKKAIDEYLAEHGVHLLLARLDDHSAMGIKPGR